MYLLDTHVVLWMAFEPKRIPAKTAKLLARRETPLCFSVATLWEVAIKSSLGRAEFQVNARGLHEGLLAEGVNELAIRPEHVFRVASLPWVHRDPFGRLLVAQAMAEQITLLTCDRRLQVYGRRHVQVA